MNNFLKGLGPKVIRNIIGLVIVLAIGGIIYLFSAQGGADSVYKDFNSELKKSAQVHTIEWSNADKETYYVTKDKKRGYIYDYTTYSAQLNCSDDKLYIEEEEDMTEDVVDFEDLCKDAETASTTNYDSTFKQFFSGQYEAEYVEIDDYYEVKGKYEQGREYKIHLYKNGKKAVWIDSDKTYTIELKKDVKLPTK